VVGLRRLITRALESAGYKVLTAATGEDALSLLQQCSEAIHVMLTDVVMPGMSGRELAERLHRDHPEMKIVYMSGYTGDVVMRHGVEEGTSFINKPFKITGLLQAIRAALDSSQSPS
jgi:CheY-like chemotaxis protein